MQQNIILKIAFPIHANSFLKFPLQAPTSSSSLCFSFSPMVPNPASQIFPIPLETQLSACITARKTKAQQLADPALESVQVPTVENSMEFISPVPLSFLGVGKEGRTLLPGNEICPRRPQIRAGFIDVPPEQPHRTLTREGPAIRLMLCCRCLEIRIILEQGAPHFHPRWSPQSTQPRLTRKLFD